MGRPWQRFLLFLHSYVKLSGFHHYSSLWVNVNIHGPTSSSSVWTEIFPHAELFGFDPGATMSVVLDLPFSVCIWISSVVAIIYTVLGGLYSVAYTDVIQLTLVLLGLVGLTLFLFYLSMIQTESSPIRSVISSFRSGYASLLFWRVTFTRTSPKLHSTTHIRPPGWATLRTKRSGFGLITFSLW